MEYKQIQQLIKLISESNIAEFKMEEGELKLSIRTKHFKSSKGSTTQQILPVQTTSVQPMAPAIASAGGTETPPPVTEAIAPAAETEEEGDNYVYVRSPIVGTFYRSPSPDKDPFIKPGDQISKGDVVCIVEAMKLFNEIESEVSGKVIKMLVDDATPVEYDQALFIVDPQG